MRRFNIYKILFIVIASVSGIYSQAQNNVNGYFSDSYNLRHELNPAFVPARSYFSLPVLGEVRLETKTNYLGISNFLYPSSNGNLVTFMHGSVDSDKFLSRLHNNNRFSFSAGTDIFNLGIISRNTFSSFGIKLIDNQDINIPYKVFDFMKNVGSKEFYSFRNMDLRSETYLQMYFGQSYRLNDNLSFGFKIKLLAGLANLNGRINRMDITMSKDKWEIVSNAQMYGSVPGLILPTKAETGAEPVNEGRGDEIDFSKAETHTGNIISEITKGMGYGAAFDLGLSYRLNESITLSAAITDLGLISWKSNVNAGTDEGKWTFEGFNNADYNSDSPNSVKEQSKQMAEDLKNLFVFYKKDAGQRYAEMLGCNMNLGAEMIMPFYKGMSVGALVSGRLLKRHSSIDARLFANLKPAKWFDFSLNAGYSTYGATVGAFANVSAAGFGMFVGVDNIITNFARYNSTILPLNKLNTGIRFGITFNVSRPKSI